MKSIKFLLAAVCVITIFTLSQCKKKTEEPQLPPETTTGAMTFGCKVNGKVFVPKDGNGRPGLYVQYVNLGPGPGGWYLNIPAINYKSDKRENINISTDSLLVQEGTTYMLKKIKGNAQAFYAEVNSGSVIMYPKLNTDSGSMFIRKHDLVQRILSGNFSFTGTNINGQKVSITDGRFDIRY
jgi:hypothetical protein